jgi:hypothetical protein
MASPELKTGDQFHDEDLAKQTAFFFALLIPILSFVGRGSQQRSELLLIMDADDEWLLTSSTPKTPARVKVHRFEIDVNVAVSAAGTDPFPLSTVKCKVSKGSFSVHDGSYAHLLRGISGLRIALHSLLALPLSCRSVSGVSCASAHTAPSCLCRW